ncbi:STAS/SEC14 domain-containing protein [bacterium]|nr:STAS/SEC14 domain-containing protein [bacterium]
MKHKLYYDEENKVLVLEIAGEYTYEDAKETVQITRDSYEEKSPYPLLVDLTNTSNNIGRDARKYLQDEVGRLGISRMALVVSNPVIRMTAKILASASGKTNESGFFKTRDEALAWLKGEK